MHFSSTYPASLIASLREVASSLDLELSSYRSAPRLTRDDLQFGIAYNDGHITINFLPNGLLAGSCTLSGEFASVAVIKAALEAMGA